MQIASPFQSCQQKTSLDNASVSVGQNGPAGNHCLRGALTAAPSHWTLLLWQSEMGGGSPTWAVQRVGWLWHLASQNLQSPKQNYYLLSPISSSKLMEDVGREAHVMDSYWARKGSGVGIVTTCIAMSSVQFHSERLSVIGMAAWGQVASPCLGEGGFTLRILISNNIMVPSGNNTHGPWKSPDLEETQNVE